MWRCTGIIVGAVSKFGSPFESKVLSKPSEDTVEIESGIELTFLAGLITDLTKRNNNFQLLLTLLVLIFESEALIS